MFEEQPGLPEQQKLEAEALAFWRDHNIFNKLRAQNRGGPRFSFLDGPITANNPMGVHHAWGRTLKDIYQRFWAMRGCDQRYQNGFDCQGLWMEVEVERELGFTSKRDIERYGIAEFVQRCKERVARFSEIITQESIRLGCWMDWGNSYYTHSDENNYAIWHFLKQCHRRGLIYPGTDVMPWCPRCGTGLSQQEMQEGYKEVVHPGVVVKFPLVGREREFLLVWTTTPWTLTANVACAVHPGIMYAKVQQEGDIYYLAASRAAEVLQANPLWKVEAAMLGEKLVGLRYAGPFDDLPQEAQAVSAHRVLPWHMVNETEGTGIVHIAPGCGQEDYDLGREHGLPAVAPIDEEGCFLSCAGRFHGKFALEANEEIVADLRARGLLYRCDDYHHRYPHCWRCGAEVLFRLVGEWFIAMDPWREEIMALARQVQWAPEWGREIELDWLQNMRDWMISKKRYWGLALPIWQCDCGWFDVIGSREELSERAAEGWGTYEGHSPHRPLVDAVRIRCEKCGQPASRVPDVGNPWLDAGIVPYSTMGYFDDRQEWDKWFPADLVIECLPGQFRNWFYALLAMSALLEGRKPAKAVVGHSVVVDERGEEMHKSKGNAVWFSEAADQMGADAVRWLCAAQPLTQPLHFGTGRADEVRAWLRTLWNVYHFFATYANVDGWPKSDTRLSRAQVSSASLDRWLQARSASAAREVVAALESFNPSRATSALLELLDGLSNWWVRRSRRRFWKSGSDTDKEAAYQTLHSALLTFSRLLAPFLPFTAEALYRKLIAPFSDHFPESVHLCEFPEAETRAENAALLEECAQSRQIIRLGRAARAETGIRVRQPLAAAFVFAPDWQEQHNFEQDILEELNVKRLEFVSEREHIGSVFAEETGIVVGLDTQLTDPLLLEGIARDLVRHIQTLRKQAGLRVEERIALWVDGRGSERVENAVREYAAYFMEETLANSVNSGQVPTSAARAQAKVAGELIDLALEKQKPDSS